MFAYNIGYGSYEESEFCALLHERKWTEDEIDDLIIEAIIDIIASEEESYLHSYQYMHEDVIKFLIKEKGFEKVEFEVEWHIFGWPSIFTNEDWKGQRGDKLTKITNTLNELGIGVEYDSFFKREKEHETNNGE